MMWAGAIFGLLLLYKPFRVFVCVVVFLACLVIGFMMIKDNLSETRLPDGDPAGQYNFMVTAVDQPDLSFSRQSPQFTVHGKLTNTSQQTLQRWVLQGTLYDCPAPLVDIKVCQHIGDWGTMSGPDLLPGETEDFDIVVNFWNSKPSTGHLRAVWDIKGVKMDSDNQNSRVSEGQRKVRAQLKEYYGH